MWAIDETVTTLLSGAASTDGSTWPVHAKLAEVVDPERRLEALRGHGPRAHDQPGVVDADVDLREALPHLRARVGDLHEIGEVQTKHLDDPPGVAAEDLVAGDGGPLVVAAREHRRRAGGRQQCRGLEADAAVGTRDDRAYDRSASGWSSAPGWAANRPPDRPPAGPAALPPKPPWSGWSSTPGNSCSVGPAVTSPRSFVIRCGANTAR